MESWLTLVLELVLPWLVFAPWRRVRMALFVVLGGFQLLNLLTANYGFFVPLALALHVMLLDEDQVRWHASAAPERPPWRRRAWLLVPFTAAYLTFSLVEAIGDFGSPAAAEAVLAPLRPLRQRYLSWHIFNTYHLFGHITTARIEPEVQTFDGTSYTPQHFVRKPGPLDRAPAQVAPHQPRVEFQLWFYGLGWRRGMPLWVQNLLLRVCHEPALVQPLFAAPLPPRPAGVRLVFWDYRFTTPSERRASGNVWRRTPIDHTPTYACGEASP